MRSLPSFDRACAAAGSLQSVTFTPVWWSCGGASAGVFRGSVVSVSAVGSSGAGAARTGGRPCGVVAGAVAVADQRVHVDGLAGVVGVSHQ